MTRWSLFSAVILVFGLTGCSDDDDKDCLDGDGDGYGVGQDCDGTDCDDADSDVWATLAAFPDDDEDGVFSPTSEDLCEAALPAGFSAVAGTDCDDNDPAAWEAVVGYVDADGDGYGAGAAVDLCIGEVLTAGYSDVDTDCADDDEDIWVMMPGYMDNDGDGVVGDIQAEVCGDGVTLPAGWQAGAGPDCDDYDLYSWDEQLHIGCAYEGTCVDSEGLMGYSADYRGIGACQSVDCNGMDVECWDPAEDTQVACSSDAFCDADLDEFCYGGTCWKPAACCNYDVAGLTCSEIPDCLQACDPDGDPAAYLACLQFDCFESATPKAQFLYSEAQNCAADNGCFIAEDMTACVAEHCLTSGFGACLDDLP